MLNNSQSNLHSNPFRSFWMGGYECTDQLNIFGDRVDFLQITGHLDHIENDYLLLSEFNISTVREGIRWSQVEPSPYVYDWSAVKKVISAGKRHHIQQVWDICHFGYAADLTPLHPMFARRFAALCRAFAILIKEEHGTHPFIVTPINEVSFISWLGGEVGATSPYCTNYGWEVKYALMKGYIDGIRALKEIDPNVRIMPTEPLVNIVANIDPSAEEAVIAAKLHEEQFQVLDMLSGKLCPELGGQPDNLDILGCNFYFNNQWAMPSREWMHWNNENNDPRWRPLRDLIAELHQRYGRPIVLSETSHPGEDKAKWIEFIDQECQAVLDNGIPLWGICWYPIIDRPDWDHLTPWHRAGLWDVRQDAAGSLDRIPDMPAINAFKKAQENLNHLTAAG